MEQDPSELTYNQVQILKAAYRHNIEVCIEEMYLTLRSSFPTLRKWLGLEEKPIRKRASPPYEKHPDMIEIELLEKYGFLIKLGTDVRNRLKYKADGDFVELLHCHIVYSITREGKMALNIASNLFKDSDQSTPEKPQPIH